MSSDTVPSIPSGEGHEMKKDNDLEFPREYFEVQAAFAIKWANLTGTDIRSALEQRTALVRRVGESQWGQCVATLQTDESLDTITNTLYGAYAASQDSAEGTNSGEHGDEIFGSEYYPDTETIKIHFLGQPRGGENILATDKIDLRRESARRAVARMYDEHPEAARVIGGSWLYNLESYRESFPPAFTDHLRQLVPAELTTTIEGSIQGMSYTGNSLWGQFVNRHGWARDDRCTDFMEAVANAKSTDDLIDAFPFKPLYASTSPEEFLAA